MKKLAICIIKFYKKHVSSGLATSCCYVPTCSEYALDALKKHSFLRAILLIISRIGRCNPLSKGGFDPVPDNKKLTKWLI